MALTSYSTLNENPRPASFVQRDEGTLSRDVVTFVSGVTAVAGTVLGYSEAAVAPTATAVANAANTGNATISAITTQASVIDGIYNIVFTGATTFNVNDPNGNFVAKGSTGSAFSNEIGFTITAGGTAMVSGDSFQVTVLAPLGDRLYYPLDLTKTDGRQIASAILWPTVDVAFGANSPVVAVTRLAEVNPAELVWPSGITTAQKNEAILQLAKQNILVRAGGDV